MNEDFLFNLIGNYIFPIFVCAYLLVKVEKTIDKNTQAINDLRNCFEKKK